MAQSTSVTLLQQLVANDDAAWRLADRYYRRMVLKWCFADRGVAYEDAEDVANETMFKAAQKIAEFDRKRTGSFRRWLRTIALNIVRDRKRMVDDRPQRAIGGTDFQMMVQSIEERSAERGDGWENAELAAFLLEELGEGQLANVQAFVEFFVCERPTNDVADELGLNRVSARRLAYRIGERLRSKLDDSESLESFLIRLRSVLTGDF
ncbi:MAG: sigma-70 family RNA polymerase sigma factor [Planctomycetaceae bacterium]|nr:sigma-70 family RNA polymerase sigma factor [Planctomycetaceae bacterium]